MGKCQICGNRFSMMGGGELNIGDTNISVCNSCYGKVKEARAIALDNPEGAKQLLDELSQMSENIRIKKWLKEYHVELYEKSIAEKENREKHQREEEQAREEELEERKLRTERRSTLFESVRKMKITTGYDFQGYRITDYKGLASGEVVLGTGFISEWSAGISDFFGTQSGAFADKMIQAKNGAIKKLMEDAHLKGGNALVGVDFDYITFSNNILGVSANGTVVVIEEE